MRMLYSSRQGIRKSRSMTERLKQAAAAYRDHSLGCSVCSDPQNKLNCCEIGETLIREFYDALNEAARKEKTDDNSRCEDVDSHSEQ